MAKNRPTTTGTGRIDEAVVQTFRDGISRMVGTIQEHTNAAYLAYLICGDRIRQAAQRAYKVPGPKGEIMLPDEPVTLSENEEKLILALRQLDYEQQLRVLGEVLRRASQQPPEGKAARKPGKGPAESP